MEKVPDDYFEDLRKVVEPLNQRKPRAVDPKVSTIRQSKASQTISVIVANKEYDYYGDELL